MATNSRLEEIEALLLELTEWRRTSGFDPSSKATSDFKSTGESNAAIENLKRKLARLGAHYHWSERAREYRLDYINASPDRIEETELRND